MSQAEEPPDDLIATMTDLRGRMVLLTEERWGHVVDHHPEMATRLEDLKKAVQIADKRTRGNRLGTEKLWASGPGPTRWLSVVVA